MLVKEPVILYFYWDCWCPACIIRVWLWEVWVRWQRQVTWKCPVETYLKSLHTCIELVPLLFLLNVFLCWIGLVRETEPDQRRLKTFQLLNLSFKISFEIVLMYKKLFMSAMDTAVFENLRRLMLVLNESLIISAGGFLGSHLLALLKDARGN